MSTNIITFESNPLCGEKNIISGFKLLTQKPIEFSALEFRMDLPKTEKEINYYNPDDIYATCELVYENGKSHTVQAFYYEGYTMVEGLCLGEKTDAAPEFRFRLSPEEAGNGEIRVTLFIEGECVDTLCTAVKIEKSSVASKRLSVEPKRGQVFATPDGTPVPLIGINLYWSQIENDKKFLAVRLSDSNIFDDGSESAIDKKFYAEYIVENMKRLAKNGVNHIKMVDCLESGVTLKGKVHHMNQDVSMMYDRIFEEAEKLGVYVTFGLLNSGDAASYSGKFKDQKVWATCNGGYIDDPKKFFDDENTIKAVKDYFRYVVSRWGWRENIVAWEIFNGIDRNELIYEVGGDLQIQKRWLKIMHEYVSSFNTYNRPITASSFFINIIPHMQESFDIIDLQQCDANGLGHLSAIQQHSRRAYKKLAIITNTGISGPRALLAGGELTEDLLAVHQNNWCGVMGGGAGTAMNHAWKKLLEFNGEWCFKGVAHMASMIPWCDANMQDATIESVNVSSNRIDVMGYKSNSYAYLWLFDNKLWPTCKYEEITFENEKMELELDKGTYTVKWLDTRTDEFVLSEKIAVSDNALKVSMPTWSKDIAVIIEAE